MSRMPFKRSLVPSRAGSSLFRMRTVRSALSANVISVSNWQSSQTSGHATLPAARSQATFYGRPAQPDTGRASRPCLGRAEQQRGDNLCTDNRRYRRPRAEIHPFPAAEGLPQQLLGLGEISGRHTLILTPRPAAIYRCGSATPPGSNAVTDLQDPARRWLSPRDKQPWPGPLNGRRRRGTEDRVPASIRTAGAQFGATDNVTG